MEELMLTQQIYDLLKEKKMASLKALLSEINPSDIAEAMEELLEDELISSEELSIIFRILPKGLAADTFVEMDVDTQEILILSFSDKELREVMDDMFVDDAVDLIEEMPAGLVKRILKTVDPDTRQTINQLLNYPEDSAGSIMTTEYADLKKDMTVRQAFARIRATGVDKETVYTCYVTDKNRELDGLVSVKDLLMADQDEVIENIMKTNVISVSTQDDQEQVAQMFSKYNFLAIPVVDREDRLVGIVTFDDAMDIMEEEATEDIEKMAAITPSGKPYLKTGVFETFKQRIPWLLLLMISATFTGMIITSFEAALKVQVVLTAFIPMLMDTGGNSGSQASVTVIRGISLGEIEFSDLPVVVFKESRVAILCGVALAAANFVKLMLFDRVSIFVAAVVCGTLVFTVFFAKVVGCILPMVAKKIGFDPAVMASPFITTIVDALSLLIYFQMATIILGI